MTGVLGLQAETAAAATTPAVKPSEAQKALIEKVAKAPIDQPMPRFDLALTDGAGKPNAHFGQIYSRFEALDQSFVKRAKSGPIDLLFLGDSITEGWSDVGRDVWKAHYAKANAANFGIRGNRTENVLWQINSDEMSGLSPKTIVLMIGTNNLGNGSVNAIVGAQTKIINELHAKFPKARLVVTGILTRGADPADPKTAAIRAKIKAINASLAHSADALSIRFLDIGDQFLRPDGSLNTDLMKDQVHPNARGYELWAKALEPLLSASR